MDLLVGYTGFVGSNLYASHDFSCVINSKNIEEAFGLCPDLCVYAGVRAEKYLADKDPENDYAIIQNSIENIKKINPKMLVLISTIDVYKTPATVNEDTEIDTYGLHPYGLNRCYLEKWVMQNVKDHLIIRLPGLFGKNLKKNFIYDMINFLPSLLNEAKYSELLEKEKIIKDHYYKSDNGFYKCVFKTADERYALKQAFERVGFSALNFTDSRAVYQFYNLAYLWGHIQTAMDRGIRLLNLATEPIMSSELYHYITGKEFVNELGKTIPLYDFHTKHARMLGSESHYIFTKDVVMDDIKQFVGAV